MPKKLEVIPGQRFGKWTVLREAEPYVRPSDRYKRTIALCRCDCGYEGVVVFSYLKHGSSLKCKRCRSRKPPGHSGFNRLYGQYRKDAEKRSYEFKLTKDQFRKLATSNCVYCGIAPASIITHTNNRLTESGVAHGKFTYNGIDRIINSKGYTPENCVPCCHECNFAKGKRTVDEFRDWLERASAHLKTNPLPVGELDETPRS